MKRICVLFLFFLLCSCSIKEKITYDKKLIMCQKEVIVNERDNEIYGGKYIAGYIILDGCLNRIVHVREYLKESFDSEEEYEQYMSELQEMHLLTKTSYLPKYALMPYYEPDRIVYPYSILDYTDLDLYTEDEVPMDVRTRDGKAIDFELYWEYITEQGMLDGFSCVLQK